MSMSKRWDVSIRVSWSGEIEADNEEEAEEKARNRIADGSYDDEDIEVDLIGGAGQ